MRKIFFLLVLIFMTTKHDAGSTNLKTMTYTYLALGDSYTIGESVLPAENFPNQVVQLLKKSDIQFQSTEIIAKTGWTTDELKEAISKRELLPYYDFVTLLIGVNNQYRGRDIENYKTEFEDLLLQAIRLANGKNDRVIVLSIPDWGVTPFAEGRDREKIKKEIDEYNAAKKIITEKHKVHFIDITHGTREAAKDLSLLAADGLHPSAKDYSRWAEKVFAIIKNQLL